MEACSIAPIRWAPHRLHLLALALAILLSVESRVKLSVMLLATSVASTDLPAPASVMAQTDAVLFFVKLSLILESAFLTTAVSPSAAASSATFARAPFLA